MPKKKQPTYGEMARRIEKMQADMKKEKERMAGVMAAAFMDDQAAAKLGDYSDADLKRIMSILAGHVDECIAKLEAEKRARQGQFCTVARPYADLGQDELITLQRS